MPASSALTGFDSARYARLIERCREAGVALHDDAGVAEHVQRVLLASDFAWDSFQREPELLAPAGLVLMANPQHADARALVLGFNADEGAALRALRVYRRREAVRLIWRDVNGLDTVEQTLAGSTALAESCLVAALDFGERLLVQRFGTPRAPEGAAQRLVVLGMGKLGGADLNFSSDIDLIFAYPENGASDGARSLANETFFARLGQLLVKLLAEITADGYVYRVDLRLRPFGSAGRVALSFAAMEQYYQREGRDWERYALIKARPVAGDLVAGKRLIEALRPFVYRRYLDYTAFAGLREMKTLIDAEVARKDLAQNLKLGAGGIREIEFIVQLLQLIRGGREPSLRALGLLPSLAACEQLGVIGAANAKRLRAAYRLLRRVENRLQMLRDEQTHELPDDALSRARLAATLDYADTSALEAGIAHARDEVSAIFAEVMAPLQSADRGDTRAAVEYCQRVAAGGGDAQTLGALGYTDVAGLHAKVVGLLGSAGVRAMSARGRARLDALLPALLDEAARSAAPDLCLDRLLRLIHSVVRRSAYLALLEEQPAARARLVALFADSALLAERVIAHPLLLDDLLDARLDTDAPDRAALLAQTRRRLANAPADDAEAHLVVLQEEKNSVAFRVGLAYRSGHLDATTTARGLSVCADFIVAAILTLAARDAQRQHGKLAGDAADAGLAVIGYGSLGGAELGFASDLDLVFVYNEAYTQHESDGARPLDGMRYYARIAQRVVHWLGAQTQAGRLYEVDVRLRPDGGKGLLVVSMKAFAEYQRARAWVWEQQALVRARPIAGDAATLARFNALRAATLAQPRAASEVFEQVGAMRARWRAERDRSTALLLDLKQGQGALLDIEFLLQALVLIHAHAHPGLLASGNSVSLIAAARRAGVLDAPQARNLVDAHALLLARGLACTLDARPRLVERDAQLLQHTQAVLDVAASLGLNLADPARR
ncbi:MAG TPA: bifunctional [glutamate--ammonia ligase]-adenylyl-L-tyrosine phosphorylase/[glutamate--ammonia-ligase] adenylyltransferase [Rudaea sp.]|uniref:bifunctional [glutamate--ammonia ligase]-adenylyl-L-tyrosine phosphorylase/[glutamate--ammonia-ligase] adenylyltransferase n=1 Tax=Rudaea sp. TaxID=2136325 RepID=UPI002F932ECF